MDGENVWVCFLESTQFTSGRHFYFSSVWAMLALKTFLQGGHPEGLELEADHQMAFFGRLMEKGGGAELVYKNSKLWMN